MKYLIFKTDGKEVILQDHINRLGSYESKIWRPGLVNYIPPVLGVKYIAWWFAHYFGIFKNKDYASVAIYDKEKVISLVVLTPTYYRWKFMSQLDLQITNVLTDPKYRNQGLGTLTLSLALANFRKPGRYFWYATRANNEASIGLCTKLGFKLVGNGVRTKKFGIKSLGELIISKY